MVSFPQVSPPKPCAYPSLPPYVPHAPPISFFSILPPAQYWVSSTLSMKTKFINITFINIHATVEGRKTKTCMLSYKENVIWLQTMTSKSCWGGTKKNITQLQGNTVCIKHAMRTGIYEQILPKGRTCWSDQPSSHQRIYTRSPGYPHKEKQQTRLFINYLIADSPLSSQM